MSLINDNFNTGLSSSESDKIYIENRVKLIGQRVEVLNKLCTDLDPYQEIPASYLQVLADFGINEATDPFQVTNQLVVLLEESIEELQNLERARHQTNN